ncbi:Condensin complex subunit 3 [Candida viswanathii]|uniref:Condensin complex subunit 3 n=1 Tax=Candida viswanathii TaxID=5486 RepID=A0A367XUP9_9ASCO|nr:Condensin complex subunit 3 [Candida viswanathii]
MDRPPKPTLARIKKFKGCDELRHAMMHVFQDAQMGLAGHRKLVVILKSVFQKAIELNQTQYFCMWFTKLLSKVLPLKRGELSGDRIVKFTFLFVNGLVKDAAEAKRAKTEGDEDKGSDEEMDEEEDKDDEDEDDDEEQEETPVSVFISYLIKYLLRGIEAKDKLVRYRVVQLLAYMVEFVTEIHDENTFEALYTLLNGRLQDRESVIRIHAVVAMSHFQQFDFSFDGQNDGVDDEEISTAQVVKKIINSLQHDESPEVRRAALINLLRTDETVPFLLERARDTNSINRRLVYSKISRELGDLDDLGIENREYLLKWGLNDRDQSVQAAAAKMLGSFWYDSVNQDLLELIEHLNVIESPVAAQALKVFFESKPELLETIKIDESYWKNLSTEKAFLVRSFYQYCHSQNLYTLINSNFPELIELAETLEKYLHVRLKVIEENEAVVKQCQAHDEKMDTFDNEIFSLENQLARIGIDAESHRKNASNKTFDVEECETAKELLKERILRLKNNDESLDDLITDENESIIEEIMKLLGDALDEQLEMVTNDIERFKQEQSDSIAKLEELQEKYDTCVPLLERKKEAKAAALEDFSRDRAGDCVPFTKTLTELEFVIHQLLLIAQDFDFSDEIGRRKMLQIIRTTLTEDKLPENLIAIGLNVLKELSINEKDFVTMAVEIITDIRDSIDDDDEFHSAAATFDGDYDEESQQSSMKKRRVEPDLPPDDIVFRCLVITRHVLELVGETLDNHLSLSSIYTGIVNYAIQNHSNKKLYLAGLVCLNLFSIIDEKIAKIACGTLLVAMLTGSEEVREIGMKSIMDILATYGMEILDKDAKYRYSRLFYKSLLSYDKPKLQCIVAEGLCKLFLADILKPKKSPGETANNEEAEEDSDIFQHERNLFEALILIYFNPYTRTNQELQQILSFCVPVYSFSKPQHQTNLANVSGDVVYRLFTQYENESISPTVIVPQLISWCDPRNLVKVSEDEIKTSTSHMYQCVYLLQVLEQVESRNVKRCIINNLNKFYISEFLQSNTLQALNNSVKETEELFENNSNDPDFLLDKTSKKNFDAFIELVKEKLEIAKKREEDENKSLFSRSNTNSILEGLDDVKLKTEEGEVVAEDLKNESDDEQEDKDTSKASHRAEEEQDEEMHGEDAQKAANIENSLQEIDKLLDEEDNVDYGDISMAED